MGLNMSNLSRQEKIELIGLLEEQHRRANNILYQTVYEQLYDWQLEFIRATKDYYECCLCAANQIGKTFLGTNIDAIHLLGEYPDDWEGHKYSFAPLCWGLGYSMEKTRDLLQKAIFGKYVNGEFEGGLVPKDRILSWESATGTPNAMRTVRVKHSTGGTSTIQFWSYSQGQHAIMGDVVDWFHIDEEPKDQSIRPQVLTRTINGNRGRGGKGIYTFTPENGRTSLVLKFMEDASPDQFFMMKGWVDASHMTEEKRTRMLAGYPEHQRDMRSKGIPMLGHGRIYDLSEEFITCPAFPIPDHFFVIAGMDFGWDHPQSHILLIEDRDSETFYLAQGWKQSKTLPELAWGAVKSWNRDVPVAWPHDGFQHEKGSGEPQKEWFKRAGFNLLKDHSTWPDGSNGVEAGILEIIDLMHKGKFKIFAGLRDVLDEVLQYHRDDKGKIVKVRDDLLDAIRYAYMMRRFAVQYGQVGVVKPKRIPKPRQSWGRRN